MEQRRDKCFLRSQVRKEQKRFSRFNVRNFKSLKYYVISGTTPLEILSLPDIELYVLFFLIKKINLRFFNCAIFKRSKFFFKFFSRSFQKFKNI